MTRLAAPLALCLAACGSGATSTPPAAAATTDPALPPIPECVADPSADALRRARAGGAEVPGEGVRVDPFDDVDGDQRPDSLVAFDCGATGDCRRALYVSGHGCAHFAGAFAGLRVSVVGGWHHGARDLETFESNGCAGLAGTLTEWSFDGTTYVDTSSLTCACPDGTNAAARAPTCPQPPPMEPGTS